MPAALRLQHIAKNSSTCQSRPSIQILKLKWDNRMPSTPPPERLASSRQGCLLFPCATNPASPWSCSKAAARLCNLLRALSRSRQNKCNAAIRTTAVAAPLTGTQPVSVRLQPPPKQCPALSAVCFRGRRLPEYNTGPGEVHSGRRVPLWSRPRHHSFTFESAALAAVRRSPSRSAAAELSCYWELLA